MICSFVVWKRKKGVASEKPSSIKTAAVQSVRKRPVPAARFTAVWFCSPSERASSAFMPTPVPTEKAMHSICSGKASETAFIASWLRRATNTLSTML